MVDVQNWKQKVRLAPDEELLALRQSDYLGLREARDPNWIAYISIVEEEIQCRGIIHTTSTDNISRVHLTNFD